MKHPEKLNQKILYINTEPGKTDYQKVILELKKRGYNIDDIEVHDLNELEAILNKRKGVYDKIICEVHGGENNVIAINRKHYTDKAVINVIDEASKKDSELVLTHCHPLWTFKNSNIILQNLKSVKLPHAQDLVSFFINPQNMSNFRYLPEKYLIESESPIHAPKEKIKTTDFYVKHENERVSKTDIILEYLQKKINEMNTVETNDSAEYRMKKLDIITEWYRNELIQCNKDLDSNKINYTKWLEKIKNVQKTIYQRILNDKSLLVMVHHYMQYPMGDPEINKYYDRSYTNINDSGRGILKTMPTNNNNLTEHDKLYHITTAVFQGLKDDIKKVMIPELESKGIIRKVKNQDQWQASPKFIALQKELEERSRALFEGYSQLLPTLDILLPFAPYEYPQQTSNFKTTKLVHMEDKLGKYVKEMTANINVPINNQYINNIIEMYNIFNEATIKDLDEQFKKALSKIQTQITSNANKIAADYPEYPKALLDKIFVKFNDSCNTVLQEQTQLSNFTRSYFANHKAALSNPTNVTPTFKNKLTLMLQHAKQILETDSRKSYEAFMQLGSTLMYDLLKEEKQSKAKNTIQNTNSMKIIAKNLKINDSHSSLGGVPQKRQDKSKGFFCC